MSGAPAPGRKLRAKRAVARLVDALGVASGSAGVRCLNYHSIVDGDPREPAQMTTPLRVFRAQLEMLRDGGYHVERASTVVAQLRAGASIQPRTVVLTFDDGFIDNYTHAYPVLRELGMPATFFLLTAALDGHAERLHNPWPGAYLDWAQARELVTGGLVEIGCHGATHRAVRGFPEDVLREEIGGARRTLEDRLGCAVTLFAYPFGSHGSWDDAAVAELRRSGFAGAFTTLYGVNTPATDPFALKRTRVSWAEEGDEFGRLVRGAYDWYELVQRRQRPVGASGAVLPS